LTRRVVDRQHRKRGRRLRLFCALHSDPAAAQQLIAAVESIESLPDHRLTPLHQIHMTLLFIGDVDASDLDEVSESVLRAASAVEPLQWRVEGIGTLPGRGAARTVAALGPSSRGLEELHRRLSQRLARSRKNRPFLPHMTLARFTPARSGFQLDREFAGPLLRFDTLDLVLSRLLPSGAEHQRILEAPLGVS